MTDRPGSPPRRGRRARPRRTALVAGASALLVGTLTTGAPAASATSAEAPAGTLRADKADVLPGMWWYDAMNIAEAHKQVTGKGVTIAVLDGAVDPTVPELRGQDVTPVRNYCTNPGEDPVATATASGPRAKHATAITALLVGNGRGTGPGGAGISGIAPDASVRHYAIDEAIPEDDDEILCSSAGEANDPRLAAQALRDAVDDGADVINMSFGGGGSHLLNKAIAYANRRDVVLVAGAGNDGGGVIAPASEPGVVSIGMLNQQARASPNSNNGVSLVATAPGVRVSTGEYASGRWTSEGVSNGTSYATPIAAGAIALTRQKFPNATNWQLIRHLVYRAGGDEKFDWGERVGFGAVSVTRMLADDPMQWRDTNPFSDVPPKGFIEAGDNELTGSPAQLAQYTESPSPASSPTGNAHEAKGRRAESSDSSGALPLALGGTIALLGGATGAAWWLRKRRA
jgi:subtilisin family serine protease